MRRLILLFCCVAGLCFLNACSSKLDEKKCTELILTHPFFGCQHVGVTETELPDCADYLAGIRRGGYVKLSGPNTDAYYYTLYGFGVTNVHDLQLNETQAICKFDLVKVNETPAMKYLKDDRLRGEQMPCQALFIKYEDGGWKLERIVSSDGYFGINIWDEKGYQPYVNFNSF